MFQGTKIHIIIQIPIILPPKINKMMPEGPNSSIFSSKSLPPAKAKAATTSRKKPTPKLYT